MKGGCSVLKWVIAFFVLAAISALFGFGLIANLAYGVFKVLFYAFLILGVLSFIFGKSMSDARERGRNR
jgi:uncharacterized membrane protein YtjA (UPF0391 family)